MILVGIEVDGHTFWRDMLNGSMDNRQVNAANPCEKVETAI